MKKSGPLAALVIGLSSPQAAQSAQVGIDTHLRFPTIISQSCGRTNDHVSDILNPHCMTLGTNGGIQFNLTENTSTGEIEWEKVLKQGYSSEIAEILETYANDPYTRTRAGQRILDMLQEATTQEERNEIVRNYEIFLSEYQNPGDINDEESIRRNIISGTGMFQTSLRQVFPGNTSEVLGKNHRDNIVQTMQQGGSGTLGKLFEEYGLIADEYIGCNVVGKGVNTETDYKVNGGNCASVYDLGNLHVSNFSVVEISNREQIAVFSVNGCNGNFGIAFIPKGNSGENISPQEANRIISGYYPSPQILKYEPLSNWGSTRPLVSRQEDKVIAPVPLPITGGMLFAGLGMLWLRGRKKKDQ